MILPCKPEYNKGILAATSYALRSQMHPRVGCVLMNRAGIVGAASNEPKTHPQQAAWADKYGYPKKIYLHAETGTVLNILKAYGGFNVGELTAYVVRLGKMGEFRSSYPCPVCAAVMLEMGIKEVVYYDDELGKFINEHLT